MKRIITLLLMTFMMTGYVSAQEKSGAGKDSKPEVVVQHQVELGETVLMICKKYVILPEDFYKYNKEAIHGITANEILRIPLHKSKKKSLIPANATQQPSEAYAVSGASSSRGPKAD